MSKITKFVGASSTLLVLGLMLTGCSAEQSKADGCAELQTGMESLQTELTENISELQTDPGAAADAISEVASTFADNVDNVTNEEVKAAGEDAATSLSTMADEFSKYADDPAGVDVEALSASATDAQTKFTELETLCS